MSLTMSELHKEHGSMGGHNLYITDVDGMEHRGVCVDEELIPNCDTLAEESVTIKNESGECIEFLLSEIEKINVH
ncbi:hypothetical protein [uncultured Selenomonas sp.]|uniref:hypothetical protein n=1 Tax=uncultured Selenomonas sp. TaxID=159275 RepID=UPI0028D76770|nr:hypothetical protein [uncultured Selenomonas sp.]